MQRPTIIAIGGFASDVGKTTLMCELLGAFPGWEAIKTTRGHYRSCGKTPNACCVGHLLSDQPLIRSGRLETYETGKDTARYWDAGAANVHWLIGAEEQVERGIENVLDLVAAPGVFVEGNSFTRFVKVAFMVMVTRAEGGVIKASARRALANAGAIYLSDPWDDKPGSTSKKFAEWSKSAAGFTSNLPVYTRANVGQLIETVKRVHAVS